MRFSSSAKFATLSRAAAFFTLVVTTGLAQTNPPVITSSTNTLGTVGQPFGFVITASGNPTNFVAAGLPAGFVTPQTNTNGVISGLPQVAGTFTSTVTAANSNGASSNSLFILVNPPAAPVLASPVTVFGVQGQPLNFALRSSPSHSNVPTTFSVSGLPSGATLISNVTTNSAYTNVRVTNYFINSPSLLTNGSFVVPVVASNQAGSSTSNVTFIINPSNAPVFTSAGAVAATVGVPFNYDVTAINSPLRFRVTSIQIGANPPVTGLNITNGTITNGLSFSNASSGSTVVGRIYGTPGATNAITLGLEAANNFGAAATNMVINVGYPTPTVILSQPLGEGNYVNGSSFYLNAQAFDEPDNILVPSSYQFQESEVIGQPPGPLITNTFLLDGTVGILGDYFGLEYDPALNPSIVTASAQNALGQTTVSVGFAMGGVNPQAPMPSIEMLPLNFGQQLVAGGKVVLSARATIPSATTTIQRVEFYVNKVYVGSSTAPEPNTEGVYEYEWTTPTTPGSYQVTARAVSVNFVTGAVPPPGVPASTTFYASVIARKPTIVNTKQGTAPSVAITSPANNGTLTVGVPNRIQATALLSGGSIDSVEFFANGRRIIPGPGSTATTNPDTGVPFEVDFTPNSFGAYEIYAIATGSNGLQTVSPVVIANAPSGFTPSVSITTPKDGLKVPQGPLAIGWTSNDVDGSVQSVQILVNGASLGAAQTAGSGFTVFTPASQGQYVFVARATDNQGNVTDSAPVTVTIDNTATSPNPSVVLDQRTIADQGYVYGSQAYFNATATPQGTNTIPTNGVSFLLGSDRQLAAIPGGIQSGGQEVYSAGYSFNSGSPTTIAGQATDSAGNTGLSEFSSLYYGSPFSPLPTVDMLTLPPSSQTVAGGTIQLRAKATFPISQFNQGTTNTSRVEFYANGVFLGIGTANTNTLSASAYSHSFDWVMPTNTNSFRLTARAVQLNYNVPVTENAVIPFYGATFSPQIITANTFSNAAPTITITNPSTNGLQIGVGTTRQVHASVTTAPNASVKEVQWYVDGLFVTNNTTFPYTYNFAPTNTGLYNIAAVVVDSFGLQGSTVDVRTISSVSGTAPTVSITTPQDGLTTPQTTLSIGWRAGDTDGSVERAELLVNGAPALGSNGAPLAIDRATDPASNPGSNVVTYTPPSQGQYVFVVRVTDNLGNVKDSDPVTVIVDNTATNPLPTVTLTQPLGVSYVAVGSEFYAAASALPVAPETINNVSFYLNGQPVPNPTGRYGTSYATPFTITQRKGFLFDITTLNQLAVGGNELFAEAEDSAGLLNASQVYRIASYGARNPLPTVTMLDLYGGANTVSVGGKVTLQARPNFPTAANQEPVVEFYANGVSIGLGTKNANNDDYSLEWSPAENGPFFITARAQAVNWTSSSVFDEVITGTKIVGSSLSDNFIVLNTAPGVEPDVTITNPTAGASVPINVPVSIKATAVVPPGGQGAIQRVEFYQNGILIGEPDVQAPFQVEFTPPSPGTYTLIAVAYGTSGLINSSTTVQFSAVSGNAPTSFLTTSTSAKAMAVTNAGAVTGFTNLVGGSGYTTNAVPDVRIVGGTTNTVATVTAVVGTNGSVTNFTNLAGGSGYTNGVLPTVVIDPPSVAVSSNTTVLLQAAAADTDGTIRQVDFLQNGVIVGTVTNAPYNFSLPVTSPGRYELIARATDNIGNVTDSPYIVVNGVPGSAPTVSISNPANTTPPAEVSPGIPVTVTVNAADADGSVARVDLLVNGVVVGFSTQAPYIFTDAGQFSSGTNTTFTPPSEGLYVIVARATDNLGNVTDSTPVTVRAKSATPVGVAPTVQITQPIGEIYYVTGSSLFLNARATDAPPGEVDPDSVDFTVNGLSTPGAVIGQIGNDYGVRYTPTEPFTIDTIRAQATDDDGNTTYSQPNYTVLTLAQAPLPQVQMLSLLPSAPLDAGGVIKLRAEAFFPPTASQQARVEFYANNVYVGTATQDATNPRLYTLDWKSPATPAAYVIEARAVALNFQTNVGEGNVIEYFGSVISDNSIAVNTIPGTAPTVEITAPTNGSSVPVGQPVTIRATAFVPSPSGPSVTEITSPQAGSITKVSVAVGQAIIVGTPLVDIQVAPGFSGTVSSTLVGTVKSIKVVPGSAVSVGSVLLEVIPVTTVTAPSAAAGGTVTSVVAVGTVVQEGTPLVGVTLPGGFTGSINSPISGVVTQMSVSVGATLTSGQAVAKIEPGGGSSGTIASVEFYSNGQLLGVDNVAPYSIDFTPSSVGLYNLNAIAYSNAGLVSTSTTISVSATLGSAPTVAITRPTQATATATLGSGGTAGRVTAITVGQSGSGYSTAPLVTLSAPPPGGVQATATAVLGSGATAGKVVSFTITEPGVGYTATPTVTIAPPSGTVGSSLLIQAAVSDSDGTIAQVEFLVNGLVVQTLTTAPYSYTLPLSSTGVYNLQVRATDNTGNVGISTVEQYVVTQGTPPVVSITSPANNANIPAGQPVTITANASDADGSVVSVTFYQNGTQIGEPDTQAPYSAAFTPGSPGQYTLVAVALDNSGNLTESAPVVVKVPSTVVTTSVVSPVDGSSFTLGTPVILTASASTTAGATITSVRFEINSLPVGNPITAAPYTTSFIPTALGSYTVRAIATDSSGATGVSAPVTFTVNNPVGSAPSIWLSQPSQGNYLTAGSSVYLNFSTFDTEGEIDPSTIVIFVNGVPLTNPAPQRIGPDGSTFGVRWVPGVAGPYVVSAQIADLDGNTASSGTTTFNVLPAQKTVPQVTIEPYFSDSQYLAVGEPIELRARAKFFANTEPVVEFYANGVFVGTGTAGASNADGTVSYSLLWTPDVAGWPVALTARAAGINFQQAEFTPDPDGDTIVVLRNVFASTISSNRPTPPVTDLTINEVAQAPVPGSNEAFVKFIVPTIFNRPATYSEYKYYVDQLAPSGNPAPNSARAQVVNELLGTVEYNASYNVVYSFYYRLGLTPTRSAAAAQIAVVQNDTNAETGFAGHTLSQPLSPNLPTIGMSRAAQNLLFTLPSQTTVGLTTNVTKPISQFSNIEFLNWFVIKLGGQAFNAQEMVNAMNAFSPQSRRQGGALAYLTQLYATYAATGQAISDSRPSTLGARNPNFQADNLAYDAKLKGITINFLLTGQWNTATAPLSISMLTNLLTNSAATAKPVVTSGDAVGMVGEYFTYQIEATNNPGGYTAASLPVWLRLDPVTGLLTGRPQLGDDGLYSGVRIGAQNWAGEGTKFITIDIAPPLSTTALAMLRSKYAYPDESALAFGAVGTRQVTVTAVPEGLLLVWTQLKDPASYGVDYEIQASNDLKSWTRIVLAPGQSPVAVQDGVPVPEGNDYERVGVTMPLSGSRKFYRVETIFPE